MSAMPHLRRNVSVLFWAIPASDLLTDLAESRVSARCNTKSVNLESVVNSVSQGRPWYNPAIEHDLRECFVFNAIIDILCWQSGLQVLPTSPNYLVSGTIVVPRPFTLKLSQKLSHILYHKVWFKKGLQISLT